MTDQELPENAGGPSSKRLARRGFVDPQFVREFLQSTLPWYLEVPQALGDGQTLPLAVGQETVALVRVI